MTSLSPSPKLTSVRSRSAPAPSTTGTRKLPTGTRCKVSGQSRSTAAAPRLGLALAGGGPLGIIYELGALRALEEAVEGLDCSRLDVYVGVSAGAVITACLANRLSTAQLLELLIGQPNQPPALNPNLFLQPAYQEYWQRLQALPGLLVQAAWAWLQQPWSFGWLSTFASLGQVVPTGVFDNTAIESYLEQLFTQDDRTNAFPSLPQTLYVVAVDLDTGQPAVFGSPDLTQIPISKAVQASAALPGLYPPVAIDGRYYVDGALSKTLHASVALENDLDLLLCLNPLVPFDAQQAAQAGHASPGTLVRGGLPVVLSQTFRTLIRSRMQVGMAGYASRYPDTDILLFEPNRDDPQCSLPTRSVSPTAAGSVSTLIRPPGGSSGSAARLWRRCWRGMASACSWSHWRTPIVRSAQPGGRPQTLTARSPFGLWPDEPLTPIPFNGP